MQTAILNMALQTSPGDTGKYVKRVSLLSYAMNRFPSPMTVLIFFVDLAKSIKACTWVGMMK